MVLNQARGRVDYDSLPIPTYEEAISRPSSAQSLTSPTSHQSAEREGLLSHRDRLNGYRQPTVESARSSLDPENASAVTSVSSRSTSTQSLRREMQEMDIEEPHSIPGLLNTTRLSKHLNSIGRGLSLLHLPQFPIWAQSFSQYRSRIPTFKLNYILFGRAFALFLVLTLAYLLFLTNIFRVGTLGRGRNWIEPEALREYFMDHIDESKIWEHLRYLTSFPHMAGTEGGLTQAKYVESLFAKTLEEVSLERFDVYLNFPKDEKNTRRVAIIEPKDLAFVATIDESTVYPDNPSKSNTPVFHGYSKSSHVQGPLIYANYGRREDFRLLQDAGINMNGSVALMKYGKFDRALKVHAAEVAGAAGAIIYNDPSEAGFSRGDVYPDGRYMPSDAVERGSVALTAMVVGDPLSPGFASLPEESRRESVVGNKGLSTIPSMPLPWRDAQKLLKALEHRGIKSKADWVGTVPNVEYWSGDGSLPQVELRNELEEVERAPIFNVLGKITGVEQSEKSIIIGNHRDAWCFGAADPNGGTAVMLEVIRVFADLQSVGWKPLRTIEFASWDGEEYNLIGSTEHVEKRMESIQRDAFAYINLDVAVVGSDFRTASSPLLQSAMLHVLDRIVDPNANKTLRTLFAEKGSKFEDLDAGSDYAAFQMLAGCSSIDFGFSGPPFPYHSCYDNFEWMERFGDPGFVYHKLVAQILAFLILDLADKEILPFEFGDAADRVKLEIGIIEELIEPSHQLDYSSLWAAAAELSQSADVFRDWAQNWANTVLRDNGGIESNPTAAKRISHNTRMANFETNLLGPGLQGREQYKHILIAPNVWDGYSSDFFPYIRSAIETGNWTAVQTSIEETATILSYASKKLRH